MAGIHAAQLRHVDGHRRSGVGRSDSGDHAGVIGTDRVQAGTELQLRRPHARIDLHCARDDLGVIGAAGIQAIALDAYRTAGHAVALQVAVDHLRHARRERGAVGVDETAARAGDAGRVGHHHLRPRPGHFEVTAQVAGIGRVDLVHDHARRARGQPGIAGHIAAQLGARGALGVVEDGAVRSDIELAIAVHRYASRAGGLDVDHRYPVGRDQHRRLLVARGVAVAQDLRMRHRVHGQRQRYGQQRKAQGRR